MPMSEENEKNKNIYSLLNSSDKKENEARNVLSKLFRRICRECNILPSRYDMLMKKYLDDPRNKIPKEGKKRSSDRNNLNKELARDDMTYNTFLKALRLLAPERVKLTVSLEWRAGIVTEHAAVFKVKDIDTTEQEETISDNEDES
jgi:hypothetical protein